MTKPTIIGDVPEKEQVRLAAMYFQAGDRVKASSRVLGVDPSSAIPGDAGTLTVAETFISKVDGGFMVTYAFAGQDGTYPARAFRQLEPVEHVVGTILTRDDKSYLATEIVMRDAGSDAPRRESLREARTLVQDVTRWVRHENAHPEKPETFFADLEARPMFGEFTVADLGDGTWRLEAVPWWSVASSKEIALAEETLAAAAPAPAA